MMRPLPPFRAQPLRADADRKPVRQPADTGLDRAEAAPAVKAERRPVRQAGRIEVPKLKVLGRQASYR